MDIKSLISEGEQVKQRNTKQGVVGQFVTGEEYERWIAKCVIYLQRSNYNSEMTNRFIEVSKKATGNGVEHFDTMMGILKAFDELGEEEIITF
ncbi:hypothetical protein SDC9_15165 [bioreactor metagenome]|uniref:Uncharacterized protein n=1 Tax=bioreactor metagenome TaxID=1076179 RepID=A0A644TR58_9ZZZZ|nr:hypothetical protein [Desulfitobacterium hafniense]MEA5023917.1 hypothetical protein [Desulfitobacterium hafniense]